MYLMTYTPLYFIKRCEACQAYLGERCVRGHLKLKTTRDHALIKVKDIRSAHKSAILNSLDKYETSAKVINELEANWASQLVDLDATLANGLEEIATLEDRVKAKLLEVFGSLKDDLRREIKKHKQNASERMAEFQSDIKEHAKEMKLLKGFVDDENDTSLLDKEFVKDLINSSDAKHTEICAKLLVNNDSTKIKGISVSNVECVLNAIPKLNLDISDEKCTSIDKHHKEQCERIMDCATENSEKSLEVQQDQQLGKIKRESSLPNKDEKIDDIENSPGSRSKDSLPLPSGRPVSGGCESPVSSQNSRGDEDKSDQAIASGSETKAKVLTLDDYIGCNINVEPLVYDNIPSVKAKQIVCINDAIWIDTDDEYIRIWHKMQHSKDNRIYQVFAFQNNVAYNATKYHIYHIVQAPKKKIVAMARPKGLFKSLLKGNIILELDDQGTVLRGISKSDYMHLAADEYYVYGVTGLRIQSVDLFEFYQSEWRLVKTVGLSGVCNNILAFNKTLAVSTLEVFAKSDKQGILVKKHDMQTNKETKVGHFSHDINMLTFDAGGNLLTYSQSRFMVLSTDGSFKDMLVGINRESMIRCATMDKNGRLFVLRSDGTLHMLIPRTITH